MRTLEFIVDKQRLRKSPHCSFSAIVAGSVGYLQATFKFSDDWNGYKKAASFWVGEKEYPVLLDENNSCVIPEKALVGEVFEVSVTGMDDSKHFIPTTKIKVKQEVQ